MNNSLKALMTQLKWQRNALNIELELVIKNTQDLRMELEKITTKLNQSPLPPLSIHPELEINRLNFISKVYEEKAELMARLKAQSQLEENLKEQLIFVKTELKRLGNYQDREQEKKQRLQQKTQDKELDEWAIQKRNSHGNYNASTTKTNQYY